MARGRGRPSFTERKPQQRSHRGVRRLRLGHSRLYCDNVGSTSPAPAVPYFPGSSDDCHPHSGSVPMCPVIAMFPVISPAATESGTYRI